jgi:hypothetical protein
MTVTINIPSQLPALTGNANLFLRVNAGENGIEWAAAGGGITIGTTSITSGTVGRVLFEGAGNVVQQNAAFVWNNTDNRLILGTEVTPDANARLVVIGKNTSATVGFAVHNSTGNNNALIVRDDGRVGIGTNAPATRLHVVGSGDERIRLSNGGNNIELGCTSGNNSFVKFGSGLLLRQPDATGQMLELVGVGTNPNTRFDLKGGAGNTLIYMQCGGANNTSILSMFRGSTETIRLVDNNLNDSYFNTTRSFVFGGTARSSASALVEMISTTQGFLPPRNADPATNITSPAEGLIAFDTTDKKLQVYDGTNWIDLH